MKKLDSVTGELSSSLSLADSLSRDLLVTFTSELGHTRFSLFLSTPGHPNLSPPPKRVCKVAAWTFSTLNGVSGASKHNRGASALAGYKVTRIDLVTNGPLKNLREGGTKM